MEKKVRKNRVKRGVADTSIKAYREIKADGQIEREEVLIYRLIKETGPTTSRALMYLSGKERGNITRTLFNLVTLEKIVIAHKDKCPVTGKTVRFYNLKEAS